MIPKQGKTSFLPASLLFVLLMTSMDHTIVSKLDGVNTYIWITSAYTASLVAGMSIFGKLSDKREQKRLIHFGIITFLLGSILCDSGQSFEQVSIYRAMQGIGGGALISIAFTMERGTAIPFVKELGMTLGITVYGIIQRNSFSYHMADALRGNSTFHAGAFSNQRTILSPASKAMNPAPVLNKISGTLSGSITCALAWALVPYYLLACLYLEVDEW
ncbi:MFS transporter [Paenibacillus sp. N3.4]|uniref:MFS transporter n=1 Tax=Paenibacillus sp. N3.4 TaxID=2603222 RepID=UPI0011C75540|nr:MFS transporter [Paenibacillus sp. N3.4]TXK85838.1 MFS transporter [Paenibacillus sp. N3.4]